MPVFRVQVPIACNNEWYAARRSELYNVMSAETGDLVQEMGNDGASRVGGAGDQHDISTGSDLRLS